MPERNLYSGYYETKTPGQNKTKRVFDSTAIYSTQRFANRLQSSLFPPYRSWCRLIVGDNAKQEFEPGEMIIFPSWLEHGVSMNKTDDIRVSLACNFRVV